MLKAEAIDVSAFDGLRRHVGETHAGLKMIIKILAIGIPVGIALWIFSKLS